MSLLIFGPGALTLVSWAHAWLTSSTEARLRMIGWILGAAVLAPASMAYAAATGQYPYILANAIFIVIAARGIRSTRTREAS
jgi:hypothetical protein